MTDQKKPGEGYTRKVFKIFWAWQDEEEEKWLEEQSRAGWHIKEAIPFSYTFDRGDPIPYTYRLDYKSVQDKDHDEYLSIFRESGWDLVAVMNNWHYYRIKPENDRIPEIYNDNRSKSVKYQRLLGALLPFFVIFFVIMPPSLVNKGRPYDGLWWNIVMGLGILLRLFWIYAIVRVSAKVIQLRKS